MNERDGAIQGHSVDVEIEWEAPGVAVERRTLTLTHDRQTLLRRTLAYDLGSARDWTVRVRRTSDPSDDERTFDDLAWTALRSYQPDEADYEGQTRLGVRIRASGQLTGRLDRLSAIVRQKVPTWDGVRWTAPLPSSNPAYLFRWYARGVRIAGRLAAGLGLAPGRIDDEALIEWGAWCAAQGSALRLRARPRALPCGGAEPDRPLRPRCRDLADRQARRDLGSGRAACDGRW